MKRSTDRILTTHTGSLPRAADLTTMLEALDAGSAPASAEFETRVRRAVADVVRQQVDVGVDIVNDGEQGKVGYSTYVRHRLTGFDGQSTVPPRADWADFPEAAARAERRSAVARPSCSGPIAWKDRTAVAKDAANLGAALHDVKPAEAFMTAASPGVIATIMLDAYYGSHERYVRALAREMRKEYELIVNRGFVLQLDCPDLAMERARFFQDETLDGFLAAVALHIDAINEAVAGLPRERIRLHLCWGNYDGPHTHDVPLEPLLPIVYRARVGALSLPLASPRHQHELKAFRAHPLPDELLFIPGVIDSTTNVVEHPEVVADRIGAAVDAVGDRTRVLAGVDCGFGTFAGSMLVEESVVWTKLRALREGADLASRRFWR
jgi:5-methyltetrahydropteroyltriglutamate--homocysteine methyltransferase